MSSVLDLKEQDIAKRNKIGGKNENVTTMTDTFPKKSIRENINGKITQIISTDQLEVQTETNLKKIKFDNTKKTCKIQSKSQTAATVFIFENSEKTAGNKMGDYRKDHNKTAIDCKTLSASDASNINTKNGNSNQKGETKNNKVDKEIDNPSGSGKISQDPELNTEKSFENDNESTYCFHPIICLGSSPAVLTATLYAATANQQPLLLHCHSPSFKNYHKIIGVGYEQEEFEQNLLQQLKKFNVEIKNIEICDDSFSKYQEKDTLTNICLGSPDDSPINNDETSTNSCNNSIDPLKISHVDSLFYIYGYTCHVLITDWHNYKLSIFDGVRNRNVPVLVVDKKIGEAVLSIAEGCRTAMEANWFLEKVE